MRFGLALAAALAPVSAAGEAITAARFTEPTLRYTHAILGDAIEWGAIEIDTLSADSGARKTTYTLRLSFDHVFEDNAPRLWDVTGDGSPEVVVVETDVERGAALAIYTQTGKLAETPHIGQRNRWLAPIGAADLDGDGHIEIAFIDRPHLAKTLRVWRYVDRELTEIASLEGLTNHRIGETDIAGGIRMCNGTPEMIVANADWTRVMAVSFGGAGLTTQDVGLFEGRASFEKALKCG